MPRYVVQWDYLLGQALVYEAGAVINVTETRARHLNTDSPGVLVPYAPGPSVNEIERASVRFGETVLTWDGTDLGIVPHSPDWPDDLTHEERILHEVADHYRERKARKASIA